MDGSLQHPQHQADEGDVAGLLGGVRFLHDVVFAVELVQAVGQVVDIVAETVGGVLGVGFLNRLVEAAQSQRQVSFLLALRRQDGAQLCVRMG